MAVAYAQCVNYPFVFDDVSGIAGDPLIREARTFAEASRVLVEPWRPFTRFTYALTHALAGFSRRAFHTTNIVIHGLNTLLVFGIAMSLARRWLQEVNAAHFGFIAASIHAVHPLHTEAVTYVSGRSSSLCALFYFGCLLLLMRAVSSRDATRRVLFFAGAGISAVFALASKEEAITLPVVAAVFLVLAGYTKTAIASATVPLALLAARWKDIALLYRSAAANQPLTDFGVGAPVESSVYVLTSIKAAVFYYLSRFIIPLTQSVDPYIAPARTIFDPGFLVACAVVILLVFIAVRLRVQQPVLSFSIAALLISPLLAYAAMPLPDVVAEHRVYIAGLGFSTLLAYALIHAKRVTWVSIAVILTAFTAGTMARNTVWSSNVRLWEQAERTSQNQVRPHLNLGAALQAAGEIDRSLLEYRHALAIRQDLPLAYSNMGTILLEQSRLDEAETMLSRAVELLPSMSQPYINLAAIAISRKKPQEALAFAAKAEQAGAARFWVHFLRADAFALTGELDRARQEYETASKEVEGNRALQDEIRKRLSAIRAQ